jgi:tetratricopeptide (TPR) repeat protein
MSAVPAEIVKALERRDWAAVEARCRATLASMPATPWASEALARALIAQGREAEADALLLKALPWAGRESFAAAQLRERLVADGELDRLVQVLPEVALGEDSIEDRLLAAVHAHRRRDFERAVQLARQTLDRSPDHAAALNHLARATHNLGREPEALELFERAVQIDPRYAEGWHNLAMARRSAGKLEGAIEAYLRSSALRPGYRSAAINLAKTLLVLDRAAQALAALRNWLPRAPQDVEARMHEGLCLHALQRLDEAYKSYRQALALAPNDGLGWMYLGVLHNQRMERHAAGEALQRAVQLLPQDGEAWAELAAWHELENRLDDVEATLKRGLAVAPGHSRLQLEAARLERRRGRPAQALDRLKRLAPGSLPPRQRTSYWFEAARNLDRMKLARQAYSAFGEANAYARRGVGASDVPGEFEHMLERLERWPRDTESAPWTAHSVARSPNFLLGFPRSGITLLNTMLGCHPRLRTLEEKPTLEACIEALSEHPAGYPDCLDGLSDAELELMRDRYWSAVQAHAGDTSQHEVLDTFPLRTLHVATIARLFPEARVLFVQRDPCDVVLSNFMQEYGLNAANLHFTSIESSARLYARTMRIWERARARLPLRVHMLRYEDLVRDPRSVLQQCLAFLGLDWDESVLTGHVARAREVRISTSSYHEVAEPLYDRSIGRWHAYRPALEPHLPLLADAARRFGYPR